MRAHVYIPSAPRPSVGHATTEPSGFSLWHMLAVGLLSERNATLFLASTAEESNDVLLDDLCEYATGMVRISWVAKKVFQLHGPQQVQELAFAVKFRTPTEICDLLGQPLVAGLYHNVRYDQAHPVVRAFIAESIKRCAGKNKNHGGTKNRQTS